MGGWEEEGDAVSKGFKTSPLNEEEEVRVFIFISVPRY